MCLVRRPAGPGTPGAGYQFDDDPARSQFSARRLPEPHASRQASHVTYRRCGYKSVTKGGLNNEGENVRHLYGAALAVVMILVMYFGAAWGYLQLLKLPVPPGQASALPAGGGSLLSNSTVLLALSALVVTAVMAGVLVVVRWVSPLASGLPGLLLLGWTALYLLSVRHAVELIPLRSHASGAGWEGLLFNGILGAVGAVMVFPLFIPSRWRLARHVETEEFARDVDDYLTGMKGGTRSRRSRDDVFGGDDELIGTVIARPARQVDTTRITGASRALRHTGSFQAPTGAQPQSTGSSRRPGNGGMLGRPYAQ